MITKKNNVWIRVAGNASNVKAGKEHGWRCFFRDKFEDRSTEEIPLTHWELVGTIDKRNYIPGTNPNGGTISMNSQVVAWIDIFGDAEIGKDDILRITLRDPKGTES